MWSDPTSWTVLVTGGSSGLGAAVCALLTDAGSTVVSLDRRPCSTTPTIEVDLADPRAAESATRAAMDEHGALDAVVCCAGVDVPGPLASSDGATWDAIVAVNLLSTAAVVRAALPALEERRGRVVTVASTLGHRPAGDATAYCASKYGVIGFTRALALEMKGRVGVTLLTPGGMHTSFFDDRPDQYRPPADAALADPCDVAETVLWALSRPEGIEVKELAVMAPAEASWP
jgi:NADP-dependent 3-hydroxy acid dehydrogenase YdfG